MQKNNSQGVQGYIDGLDGAFLCGWAYQTDDPYKTLEVEIFVDGSSVGKVSAALDRPDLKHSDIPQLHGFRFPIPDDLKDGKIHVVDVNAEGKALRNAPFRIAFPALPPTQDAPAFEGHFDGIVNGFVRGWVLDLEHLTSRVSLDLLIDAQFVRTFEAGQYRPDLGINYGSGYHGFHTPVPKRFLDEKMHTVAVVLAGTDTHLKSSPLHTVLGMGPCRLDEPEQTHLARRYFSGPSGVSRSGSLSIVMPTYNRGQLMEETTRLLLQQARELNAEVIVIDDGSTDDTPQRLESIRREWPALRFQSGPNRGPGQCRNLGASVATKDIVLFVGDDVRPASSEFFTAHTFAHQMMPEKNVGVLGKMIWPNQPNEDINFVMSHIQGMGKEQFGFYALEPYTWLDWRFFYTSNVSIKRKVVNDWLTEGFSNAFPVAAYEDGEFAYRMDGAYEGGFKILYASSSVATHHHPYSVRGFIRRQNNCGRMARVFLDLHPEAAEMLGIATLESVLSTPFVGNQQGSLDDYLAMIEGLKAWPNVINESQKLGSQNWHADLLAAVFEISYLEGYLMASGNPTRNQVAAYQYLITRFQERMSRAATIEVFGRFPSFAAV